MSDAAARKYCEGRIAGLRIRRYSWWIYWRELAEYFLPRRYRWLVTANQMNRGSPINGKILDASACIYSRNLASGLVAGKSSPTAPWFKIRVGYYSSTGTNPVSLWLAECERILYLIFTESNFYNSMAVFYYDLVIFGSASMIIYEDYDNVISCVNPCLGEFYIDVDAGNNPTTLYREYTKTIANIVEEFGIEKCSPDIQRMYKSNDSTTLSQERVIGHCIEPNNDGRGKEFGISERFAFREMYWEIGASANQGEGATSSKTLLRKGGFYERPNITGRWDITSNDAYGRSPGMDALGDQKQLQLETRRKAQAIDKMVNPPLVADAQLKNAPANLTPGGITFVHGFAGTGKPGFASVYDTKFPVQEITEDLAEIRNRLATIFYNDVLRVASQYETRSNVTAIEWDLRKSESLVMLGPALDRIDHEVLGPVIDRVFGIAMRAGILPPPPPEIQGMNMDIDFVSVLAQAQQATKAGSIERVLSLAGNIVGVVPDIMDKINIDYAIDKYSELLNNDPSMMRSNEEAMQIRQNRQQQQQQAAAAQQAQQLAQGAKNLSETNASPDNVLGMLMGQP